MEQNRLIYSLQKYMILQTKLNPQTKESIPDEYAYAWYVDLYPIFNDGEWHENVKECFKIGEDKVTAIITYLDAEWLKKNYYNFYEIEKYYNYMDEAEKVDRNDLLCVLRYVFLHGGFDGVFWDKLLKNEQHPVEATSIVADFDISKIYLV